MQFHYAVRGTVWVILYLVFILAPLFALLAGSRPPARGFWTEFSVAIGYSGLAMMGLQFGLTARFRYITEPWGEDVIYHFHRQISLIAVGLVVAHPLIMFAVRPELFALPDYNEVPWGAVFAFLSLFSLVALVVTALWRAKLKIGYETWHLTHMALAVVAVTGGLLHMVAWGFYLTDPWKRALWIGLTIFWIGLLLYVRIVKPLFMLRRPYRVSEVRRERGDTTTLVMQPEGHPGFRFRPGQFGWLTVWGSPFKITGHPFSFSSSAALTDGHDTPFGIPRAVSLDGRSLGPHHGAAHQGLPRTEAGSGQSHDLRADVIHVPAVLVPGLRPVSVKGIQAALRARSDPPLTELAPFSPREGCGLSRTLV
jgi:predicted ferric reductase